MQIKSTYFKSLCQNISYICFSECIDENKFSCVVGGKYVCLENNPRCDGKEECDDKSDERDCRGKFAKPCYKLVI